ncbi:MAG: helix-turn-helix domain-containing protein [Pseudomonadota bacterium]
MLLQRPEGKTLEFKRDLSSPKRLLKTLVAFANTAGGRLIVGMDDNRQVTGVEQPLDEEERLCSLIADSISPRLVPNVELMTVEGKTLLVVEVFVSGSRPHWLKAEGSENGVYVRLGSTNRQADRELIAELRRSAEGGAFDEMPMPELSTDDLDLSAAQALFAGVRTLDEQTLRTLKLLTPNQGRLVPTKGAVLLFGKQRNLHFSDAWAQCGRFVGKDKAEIFDHIEIYDHLPQAVDSILLFLKKHAMRSADFSAVRRKDVWSIPLGILREAVINALVHADYSQRGAPIRIAFFDDRIEIENPGILLPGMTVEDMRQGVSKIRNHVLARVFRELNLIEQWGSGVRRMFKEAEDQGLPEPKIIEIGMRIRFTVPLLEQILVQPATVEVEAQVEAQVDLHILAACAAAPFSSAEIAATLGHKQLSGNLRKALPRLRAAGLLEYTIPEKPNSRLQKYRLTEKGRSFIATKHTEKGAVKQEIEGGK